MADFEGAARATAEWWADKVFGPAVAPITDRNDPDPLGGTAFALQSLLKASTPVQAEKRGEYVEQVTAWVKDRMDQMAGFGEGPRVSIMTDYGSSVELRNIDQRLGISGSRYPSKSISFTYADHVAAEFGYHGGTRLVWAEEGWEHPVCGQGQWDLSNPRGGRLPFRCSAPQYHPVNEHVFDTPDPICQAPDPYGRDQVCGHSADDYHHNTGSGDRFAHEFQPSA